MLPCLDEAGALAAVLSRLPAGYRAVVVDNGSTDGSPQIARDHGATVVSHGVRGYGAACHAGLEHATAAVVAFADADGSLDLADLAALAGPVLAGEADLVLGRRTREGLRAVPWHARVSNRVLSAYLRTVTSASVHDIAPLRVGDREKLLALGLTDRRSGYPLETLLRAARAGLRVQEVRVGYVPRTGRSKVTGTVRGTLRAVHDMAAVIVDDVRTRGWTR